MKKSKTGKFAVLSPELEHKVLELSTLNLKLSTTLRKKSIFGAQKRPNTEIRGAQNLPKIQKKWF